MPAAPSENARASRGSRSWLLAVVAVLPLLVPAVLLLAHARTFTPDGDDALIERSVRAVGTHAVLLGPYSRFGWHHPGPAMYYLLAGPYRLLDRASVALPLASLALGIACIVGIGLVLRRRAGVVAMVGGLVVVAGYLLAQEPAFLLEDWNPDLPLLPFCLGVLLCWSLMAGERWPLPVCLAIGSLCVQSHVGYGIGVAAVAGATAVGMLLRLVAVRRILSSRSSRSAPAGGWTAPLVVAALVLAVMWLPVLVQQLTGHPGNLTALADYFGTAKPSWGARQGLRELSTAAGRPAALVAGVRPKVGFLVPAALPIWTGLVGGAAALVASVVLLVRHRSAAPLVLLVASLSGAVVLAVTHVVGPLFSYLVPFTWAAGLLVWVLVVVAVSLETEARRARSRRPTRALVRWASVPLALAMAAAFVPMAVRTSRPAPFDAPDLRPLAAAVQRWDAGRPGLVKIDAAPTTGLVGSTALLSGLYVLLERDGAPVRVDRLWASSIGVAATRDVDRARWLVQVGYTDASTSPPGRGQRVLARVGAVQAYISELPATG